MIMTIARLIPEVTPNKKTGRKSLFPVSAVLLTTIIMDENTKKSQARYVTNNHKNTNKFY